MGALSLRLPESLDHALSSEAALEMKPRSAVVRQALAEYLQRMEKERFMQTMVAAASALSNDPASRKESLDIVATAAADALDSIQVAEAVPDNHTNEKWWK